MKLRMVNGKILGNGVSIKSNKDGTQSISSVSKEKNLSRRKAAEKRHSANKVARKNRKRK